MVKSRSGKENFVGTVNVKKNCLKCGGCLEQPRRGRRIWPNLFQFEWAVDSKRMIYCKIAAQPLLKFYKAVTNKPVCDQSLRRMIRLTQMSTVPPPSAEVIA